MSETILITGVGERLGFALAQQLLSDGYNVVALTEATILICNYCATVEPTCNR